MKGWRRGGKLISKSVTRMNLSQSLSEGERCFLLHGVSPSLARYWGSCGTIGTNQDRAKKRMSSGSLLCSWFQFPWKPIGPTFIPLPYLAPLFKCTNIWSIPNSCFTFANWCWFLSLGNKILKLHEWLVKKSQISIWSGAQWLVGINKALF